MMTCRLPILAAIACALGTGCYPVQEHPRGNPRHPVEKPIAPSIPREGTPAATVTPGEIKPAVQAPVQPSVPEPRTTEQLKAVERPLETKPPAAPPQPQYPTASKAAGKEGYVLSPYTQKLMLVRGIPSGTIVPDQTCPPSEKKFFRVP